MPNRLPNSAALHSSPADDLPTGCTIGVLGGQWRGTVTPWGAVQQWDGLATLDWHVAADDRWHTPSSEPTIRQSRIDGTPVIETRLRVPQGDVVQRVYAVADHGGFTIIEIENDSTLPVAVAFSGCPVASVRPPARVPIEGIELPADAVVFPVGHHATIAVGLSHGTPVTALPSGLATAAQVARGWTSITERASRLALPDATVAESVTAERCELLLAGPPLPQDDPVGFLLGVHQLVRMTAGADSWMLDVADAVAHLADRALSPDSDLAAPELFAALDAAAAIADHADDRRARRDLAKLRARLEARTAVAAVSATDALWLPDPQAVSGVRLLAAVERRTAVGGDLLPGGIPSHWLGQNFEVHGVPTVGRSTVSYAVRWHGDRPAELWECSGEPVRLTASSVAPGWSTDQPTGETLWPAQAATTVGARAAMVVNADDPGSFS
ncbi:MAG: hypothetical protein JWN99_1014 [Ilumatobacteraceae bacterium]|nr:hypothetical protein [Ilumatobacteraceae bacterium]